jgi:hypothetical protein
MCTGEPAVLKPLTNANVRTDEGEPDREAGLSAGSPVNMKEKFLAEAVHHEIGYGTGAPSFLPPDWPIPDSMLAGTIRQNSSKSDDHPVRFPLQNDRRIRWT